MIIETVYDLLAELYALMDKDMERQCAIQRTGMDECYFKEINEKYEPLIKIVLNSIAHEYTFSNVFCPMKMELSEEKTCDMTMLSLF